MTKRLGAPGIAGAEEVKAPKLAPLPGAGMSVGSAAESKSVGIPTPSTPATGEKSVATPAAPVGIPTPRQTVDSKVEGDLVEVDTDLIDVSPYQPRLKIDEAELLLLADSMGDEGPRTPIKLRKKANGRFELIGGERRWRASKIRGMLKIKAIVVEVDEAQAMLLTAIDNEGGHPLSDYERARMYKRVLDDPMTKQIVPSQAALARMVGCERNKVVELMGFFRLPSPCLQILDEIPDLVSAPYALEFAQLATKSEHLVIEAFDRMRAGMNMTAAANWVKGNLRPARAPISTRHVSLGDRYVGQAKLEGRKLTITCNTEEAAGELMRGLMEKPSDLSFHEGFKED